MALIIGSLNGCYSTADGGTKAGMPWLKDSVVGRYERPVDQIFEAAIEVIRFNGAIESENSINHSLIGRIDTRKIWGISSGREPHYHPRRGSVQNEMRTP